MSDWNYSDDYREQYVIRETPHGVFRAKVVLDEYPHEPEDELGDPVFRLIYGGWSSRPALEFTGYGKDVLDAASAWDHFQCYVKGDPAETFERWLRIFHDGVMVEHSSNYHRDYHYIAYTCRELREERGVTPEDIARHPEIDFLSANMDEWKHYAEGEVYGIDIAHAVSFDEDGEPDGWETLEDCWGYYGEKYARQEALDYLDFEINHAAAGMLPLDAKGETA